MFTMCVPNESEIYSKDALCFDTEAFSYSILYLFTLWVHIFSEML